MLVRRNRPTYFRSLGPIFGIQVIARGRQIRIVDALVSGYGQGRWRKMKGKALIEDDYGWTGIAEIHWYEAHGVGKFDWKVKRKLSED